MTVFNKLCHKCGCLNEETPLIINGVQVCRNCREPLPKKKLTEIQRLGYTTVGVK